MMIMVISNDHADGSHDTCMLNVINMINSIQSMSFSRQLLLQIGLSFKIYCPPTSIFAFLCTFPGLI